MVDGFRTTARGADGPATGAEVVNIASTDHTFVTVPRGLYVGVGGDVKVDLVDGASGITFPGMAAGIIHPIRALKVYKTGTTAGSMVGVW